MQVKAAYFNWSHHGNYIYLTTAGTDSVFARIRVPDAQPEAVRPFP